MNSHAVWQQIDTASDITLISETIEYHALYKLEQKSIWYMLCIEL